MAQGMRQTLGDRLRMVYTKDEGRSYLLAMRGGGGRHLRRHAEGRNSGARLSGGHFIRRLVAHFGLRQPEAAAGAPRAAKDAPAVDEGAQANPTPEQGPQPLPPVPKTMQLRISRLEEEVHELRQSIVRLRGDVARSITNQGSFNCFIKSVFPDTQNGVSNLYGYVISNLSGRYQSLNSAFDFCKTLKHLFLQDAIRRILGYGIRRIDLLYSVFNCFPAL
ncbi:hypothetical protein Tco_0861534 [Tanacetum coccineum]|uniref:Uncharacterized protein n=1 Tax=Tanacetum coccineum TaxID=301880 RepID=A0ABQ5BK85_9ASTR